MIFFFFFIHFRYFVNLFYSFHCLSFPFPKGCRLEKGHTLPILCSHSYKKKKKKKISHFTSVSPSLLFLCTEQEVEGVRVKREIDSGPVASSRPSAQVRLYKGNRFVLIATKAEVNPSLNLFARYKCVPLITLPSLLPPSCRLL